MKITSARAIAEVTGQDLADMPSYRYQSTKTPQPVFVIGGAYYAAGIMPKFQVGKPWKFYGDYCGTPVWESEAV
jgi:hypothetical protein